MDCPFMIMWECTDKGKAKIKVKARSPADNSTDLLQFRNPYYLLQCHPPSPPTPPSCHPFGHQIRRN